MNAELAPETTSDGARKDETPHSMREMHHMRAKYTGPFIAEASPGR
jgi:hypothetical protein